MSGMKHRIFTWVTESSTYHWLTSSTLPNPPIPRVAINLRSSYLRLEYSSLWATGSGELDLMEPPLEGKLIKHFLFHFHSGATQDSAQTSCQLTAHSYFNSWVDHQYFSVEFFSSLNWGIFAAIFAKKVAKTKGPAELKGNAASNFKSNWLQIWLIVKLKTCRSSGDQPFQSFDIPRRNSHHAKIKKLGGGEHLCS